MEDMTDIITNISPSETPLLSSFGRNKATGVYHTWLEDSLGKPGENMRPEGGMFFVQEAMPRKQYGNWTQIMSRGYEVTGTQEVVAKRGVRSELAYQMQKATKELAMDQEWAIINNGAKAAQTAATGTWEVHDGINKAHPGTHTPGADGTTNAGERFFTGLIPWIGNEIAGGGGDVTEAQLNEAIQVAWTEGGNPKRAFMSPNNKRVCSAFDGLATNRTVNKEMNNNRIVQAIRFYESDFGVIELLPHRMFPNDTIAILDSTYIKMADLRPTHRETMPKVADSVNGLLLGEHSMEVRAQKAHCKITGLAPTGNLTRIIGQPKEVIGDGTQVNPMMMTLGGEGGIAPMSATVNADDIVVPTVKAAKMTSTAGTTATGGAGK
jgi:hypothetical protein